MALAAMNFMRSPEGVITEPAFRSSRFQVASPVSWFFESGMETMATRFFPSVLIETDWMFGRRANESIGIASRAVAVPVSSISDAAIERILQFLMVGSYPCFVLLVKAPSAHRSVLRTPDAERTVHPLVCLPE